MADYLIHDSTLEDIADAIRSKTGDSAVIAPEDMPEEIASIETGGGIEQGLEVVATLSNGTITEANWYGDIPRGGFVYNWYNYQSVLVHFVDNPTFIPTLAMQNGRIRPDISTLASVVYMDSYAFAHIASQSDNFRDDTLSLPNYTGEGYVENNPNSVFRTSSAYYYGAYYLPKMHRIGDYFWYTNTVPNVQIQIGSVGYPVTYCGQRPFGGSTGSGTITIYTTGELLDTIKTAVQNQAGASYTFVYKASEATTYNGTTYAAGDTMLTV